MNTPDQPTAPGYSGLSKQEVAERLKQPAATRTLADCSPQEIEKLSAQFAGIEPTATATPRTDEQLARAEKAEAEAAELREDKALLPVPDRQGVLFGNAWVSYDRLTGYEGEDGPDRDAFYANTNIARGIMEWANKVRQRDAARKEGAGLEKVGR